MRHISLLLIVLLVAVLATGCTTAIKEGVGIARGASGSVVPLQPVSADPDAKPLGEYQNFELGAIQDGIRGKAPADFLSYLPQDFRNQCVEKRLPMVPGGKTLVIRGTIEHYESENLVGVIVGPLEEVLIRGEMVDKDTGQVLATANLIGRTTERVNQGVKKKSEGMAKAMTDWILLRFPKDRLVQKQ